ncbi:MAG: hypothetical protein ABUS48_01320 [Pseudomonadota bacterium]
MSLFQLISIWSLRALAVWAVIEFGGDLYEDAMSQLTAVQGLAGQAAAMQRLEARADAAEQREHALQLVLNAAKGAAPLNVAASEREHPERVAADLMRADLISLGAEAPVVDSEASPLGGGLIRVTLHAHWREADQSSPAIIYGLALRHPNLSVKALRLDRAQSGGFVDSQLDLESIIQTREAGR